MSFASSHMVARAVDDNYVLRGHRVSWAQKSHAAAIIGLPALAVVAAGYEVCLGRTKIWEPALMVALYTLTFLGVTVGFHRMLAHRAFEGRGYVRVILAVLGSMAAQGPLIYWVSNHRRHHRFGDDTGDPHSPRRLDECELKGWSGFLHAHFGWTFTHQLTNSVFFCKDLLRDPQMVWVNRHYFKWVMLGVLVPVLSAGCIDPSLQGLWEGFLWGAGVRLFFTYHAAACINSITHMFGYRSFETNEESRNNIWIGLPTLGEGWHNNHHANPASAFFGLRWWELDPGGFLVRLLERTGLVWNVHKQNKKILNKAAQS